MIFYWKIKYKLGAWKQEMDYFDYLKPTKTSKKPLDCLTSFERFEIETNDFIKTFFFINTSNGF